ncbi:unknown [Methanoculleus sp. CAG:1088]|nr:unknown [Methanoculleus sp. CAG:1088]
MRDVWHRVVRKKYLRIIEGRFATKNRENPLNAKV